MSNAKKVYSVEEIELEDGNVVKVKPCKIKTLRDFMDKINEWAQATDPDAMFDLLVEAAAVCIAPQYPQYYTKSKNEEERLAAKDAREEAFDMETVHYIIEKMGGIKLRDEEAAKKAEEAMKLISGANSND